MSKEEVIRMARKAAKEFGCWDDWDSNKPASGSNGNDPHEERDYWISLVEFIAAAEREACAKVCDAEAKRKEADGTWLWEARRCAAAIRARGQA